MYSFLPSVESLCVKSQVREQIFSLLGNTGKTLFSENGTLYAEVQIAWYQKVQQFIANIWHTPYKRILAYMSIVLASLMIAPPGTSFAAEGTTTKFIVTAYYSPLPGQSFYLKGNYEAEKRLNGNGTHGASGAPVFTGMIAAPKTYDFGTQIFFEGLGVGTVSDRGGAIVEAWDRGQAYDRIDIWMGRGESGLRRALAWGRREVVGTIISAGAATHMNTVDISGIDSGRINLADFPAVKSSSANGGISSDVLSAFADLGYTVTGNDVESMILQFQLDHEVIASASDVGAGNYGPKTKAALKKAHDTYASIRTEELDEIEAARKELLDERTAWQVRYQKAQSSVSVLTSIERGDNGTEVLKLQSFLAGEGFFTGRKDGKMLGSTIYALRKYQGAHGLKQTGLVDTDTKNRLLVDILEA